jgi:diguanylate cyclase (GGDEF)-like protein
MADLDHFKKVNDTLGHAAGDAVLREAARRIAACVRPYDSPCRYGGEEFLIVLPGCDLAGAAMRAEHIRSAIGDTPFQIPEGTIDLTCSLGIASAPSDTASPSQRLYLDSPLLIQQADEALYLAKNNGRNRVEALASPGLLLTH